MCQNMGDFITNLKRSELTTQSIALNDACVECFAVRIRKEVVLL